MISLAGPPWLRAQIRRAPRARARAVTTAAAARTRETTHTEMGASIRRRSERARGGGPRPHGLDGPLSYIPPWGAARDYYPASVRPIFGLVPVTYSSSLSGSSVQFRHP